jgi:hypothetical protein
MVPARSYVGTRSLSNLVVRGLATENVVVTAGLGPPAGSLFQRAVSGILTMVGSLSAVYQESSGTDAQKNQGGTSISIDLGVE